MIQDIRNFGFRRTVAWYLVRLAAKIWDDEFLQRITVFEGESIAGRVEIVASHWGSGVSSWMGGNKWSDCDVRFEEAECPKDWDSEPDWQEFALVLED